MISTGHSRTHTDNIMMNRNTYIDDMYFINMKRYDAK